MSATNRGAERLRDDAYSTPQWAVWRLLEVMYPYKGDAVLVDMRGPTWCDAGAGTGAIMRAVNAYFEQVHVALPPKWLAVEQNARMRPRLEKVAGKRGVRIGDFLDPKTTERCNVQAVIMNPPYSLAQQFIERALEIAPLVMALTRLNYLGSEDRADFMREHTPSALVLPNRPSFAVSVGCPEKKGGCGYKELFPAGTKVAAVCPECGSKVSKTTSDATEYCWLVWGRGSTARVRILGSTSAEDRCG